MKHLKSYQWLVAYGSYVECGSSVEYGKSYPKEEDNNPCLILPDDIIKELKDICLEITDMGFNVKIESGKIFGKISTVCLIERDLGDFILTEEIFEVIERMIDYLSSKGYNMEFNCCGENVDDELDINSEYSDIWIRFTKK